MSHEPTSDHRQATASGGSGAHPAHRSGGHSGVFDPVALSRKYPHLQPAGAHAAFGPIPLHRPITLIGSRKTARIHLNSSTVSRAHALLVVTPGGVSICDLHSREGTLVNGRPVREADLAENDEIQVGRFSFIFHDPRPAPEQAARVEPMELRVDSPAGRQKLTLTRRVTLIGRRSGSDLHLPFPNVSTANTAIVRLEGFSGESDSMAFAGYAIFDLGGKGTLINGRPAHKARLKPGTVIGIGPAKLSVVAEAPTRAPAPAPRETVAPPVEARAPVIEAPTPPPALEEPESATSFIPEPAVQPAPAPAAEPDRDEILLDEELTPEGLDEDLLGGSHVLPAIAEPEAEAPEETAPAEPVDDWAEEEAAHDAPVKDEDVFAEREQQAAETFDLESLPAPAPSPEAFAEPEPAPSLADETPGPGFDEIGAAEPEAVVDTPVPLEDEAFASEGVETEGEPDWAPADVEPAADRAAEGQDDEPVAAAEEALAADPELDLAHELHLAGEDAVESPDEAPLELEPAIEAEAADAEETPEEVDFSVAFEPRNEPATLDDLEDEAPEPPQLDRLEPPALDATEAPPQDEEATADDLAELEAFADQAEADLPAEEVDQAPADDDDLPVAEDEAELLAEEIEPDESPVAELGEDEAVPSAGPVAEAPRSDDIDLSRLDFTQEESAGESPLDVTEPEKEAPAPPASLPEPVPAPAKPKRRKGTGRRRKKDPAAPATVGDITGEFAGDDLASDAIEEPAPEAEVEEPAEPAHAEAAPVVARDAGEFEVEPEEPVAEAPPAREAVDDVPEHVAPAAQAPVEAAPEVVEAVGEPDAEPEAEPEHDFKGFEHLEFEAHQPAGSTVDDHELDAHEPAAAAAPDESWADHLAAGAEEPTVEPWHEDHHAQPAARDHEDLVEEPAEPVASGAEAVSELTEPTPESALDLSQLDVDRDEEATDLRHSIGALSDSAFQLELEALTDPRGGLVKPKKEPPKAATPPRVQPSAKAPPAKPPASRPPTSKPGPSNTGPKQPVGPGRDWRQDWETEQSAFLGNLTPLEARKPPAAPGDQGAGRSDQVEELPEGLGEEYAPQPRREPAREGGSPRPGASAPPTPPAPERSAAPQQTSIPTSGDRSSRGPAKGPRPKTVGFSGPVAEVEQAVAPNAATPFSSAPVHTGGAPVLDPSAAMPETSGLQGLANLFGAPAAPAEEHEPLLRSEAPAATEEAPATAGVEKEGRVGEFLRTTRGEEGANGTNGHAPNGTAHVAPVPPDFFKRQPDPFSPLHSAMDAEAVAPRRRSLWLVPLLLGLMVAAMIGAVVGIYFVLEPTAPVTLRLRYDIPPTLDEGPRRQYKLDELTRLQTDDSLRENALNALQRTGPGVEPAYLADRVAFNKFAVNNVDWSLEEPDTLLLRREVPEAERAAEIARLKAIGEAIYVLGGTQREARRRHTDEVRQLSQEIDDLRRREQALGQEIEDAVAALPEVEEPDPARAAERERELAAQMRRLDEQWSVADRRVTELKEEINRHQGRNPLAEDERLAELRRRLSDVEAHLAGSAIQAGASLDAGGSSKPPVDVAALRDLFATRAEELSAAAARAAGEMTPEAGQSLVTSAEALAGGLTAIVDETLPAHRLAAGEVELLRQSLSQARRERLEALLAADETVQLLEGEIALKERELGAAVSDGLTDEAAGLRMALRLARDQLEARQAKVAASVEADQQIVAARKAYEAAEADALEHLGEERQTIEAVLGRLRADLRAALAGAGAENAAALTQAVEAMEAAAREIIRHETERLPLAARVWEAAASEGGLSRREAPAMLASLSLPAEALAQATQSSDLKAEAEQLRKQIEQRESELNAAHEKRLVELRQELAAAEAAAAKARREAQEARARLGDLQAEQESVQRARDRIAQLRLEKLDRENEIAEKSRDEQRARLEGSTIATPLPPSDPDITAPQPQDDRIRTMVIALAGIAAVFLLCIYFALRSDARTA